MGKYIKLFDTHFEYNTYISGQDAILPNVSYCEDNNDVHYNPFVPTETRLIATFNVTSTNTPTSILYSGAISQFIAIEIDGVVQPSVVSSYTFDTTGEHTVKYTLSDPTSIGNSGYDGATFLNCYELTSAIIPDSVETIGRAIFADCESLVFAIFGTGVTSFLGETFYTTTHPMNYLESITIKAITPPSVLGVYNMDNTVPIYVPAESVNVYKTATGWTNYANNIQAIPTT